MQMTATQLGSIFGRGAAAMNVLLKDHGFLEGRPGDWQVTELGKQFVSSVDFDNGYGGYAHRTWGWLTWSDGLVDALKASVAANPNGIQSAVAEAATASPIDGSGHALGKYKWPVMAAVGVVAAAAPAAKNVISRITARKGTETQRGR